MTNSSRNRLLSWVMVVIALAAVAAALVGGFWPLDNSDGVGCGSVFVSTSTAADRDEVLRDKAVQELIARSGASEDGTGDTYQNNIGSPAIVDGPLSVLSSAGNVGLCEDVRSTVRTYLYSTSAAVLVLAGVGWIWLRRRRSHADNGTDS